MNVARLAALLALPTLLAACGAPGGGTVDTYGHSYSSDAEVARVAYRDPGPARLTLLTMVNNNTGSGAHTSLMINASQRVIFDPAGTVNNKQVLPEQGDVLYGITPRIEGWYKRAHARDTHRVIIQDIDVSPEVAELALRLVQATGGVGQAQCAAATSAILSQLPGFQSISSTWFPNALEEQFQALPGVRRTVLREADTLGDRALADAGAEQFTRVVAE